MKAILVIDMPERCVDCPLCEGEGYPLCTAIHKSIGSLAYYFGGDKERNPYCPLRPMPQKKEVEANRIEDIMHTEYSIEGIYTNKYIATIRLATDKLFSLGWNACLKEITE